MITFPCRCRHVFELDESEAGGLVQCPACGLLNDVPTLGDLPNLLPDGTYTVGDAAVPPSSGPSRIAELGTVFTRSTTDAQGNEIDLRNTPEQIAMAGSKDGPALTGLAAIGNRPRYDPETGELIRPIEIKPDPMDGIDRNSIPLARSMIDYASVHDSRPNPARWTMFRLLMPINLLVMFIIFVMHAFVQLAVGFFFGAGIALISPVLIILQFLIVAHYGNVISETGPEGNDELPRFLRDLRFGDDIWSPMVAMLGGFLLCYSPALFCLVALSAGPSWFTVLAMSVAFVTLVVVSLRLMISIMPLELNEIHWMEDIFLPIGAVIASVAIMIGPAALCCMVSASTASLIATGGTLALAGTLAFPAVILTLTTSGTSVNLRPDRVLECIRICGRRYWAPLIAWAIAVPTYVAGLFGTSSEIVNWVAGNLKTNAWLALTAITMPLMMVGIYFMHLFCWEIGLLYRRHHEEFPWLFQRHAKREPAFVRPITARREVASSIPSNSNPQIQPPS